MLRSDDATSARLRSNVCNLCKTAVIEDRPQGHPAPAAADDRRQALTSPNTTDVWVFDIVQPGGGLALTAHMVLDDRGTVGFHFSVARPAGRLISLVEPAAAAPRMPSLEVRASGLWTEIGIQTPLEHVTLDLEAFAVALDHPDDVFDGAFGERIALGCELEWETAGDIATCDRPQSYAVPCVVHGELLVGADAIEIDGFGWRSHRWGARDGAVRSTWQARTLDGSWVCEASPPTDATVMAQAPVPDLGHSHHPRLDQDLVSTTDGTLGWLRTWTAEVRD